MKSELGMESTAIRCSRGHLWADNNRREYQKKNPDGTPKGQIQIQCRTCNNESYRRRWAKDPEKERARKRKELR